ncbi:hypothetical protein LCGC14_0990040 [marine sediment metagenome]|uniref:Uncharacterized protein n=1 Tax=marine sediment metagenome TaxID=412755 RepID=A0A0F9QPG1_9ZZZZ
MAKQDELDVLANRIERGFMQPPGWKGCRYLLGKLVEERDETIRRLQLQLEAAEASKENSCGAIGVHGPNECPAGACDGCEGFHHWLPECADDDTLTPRGIEPHPAIQSGLTCWFECKHCSAWCEEMEED